MSKKVSSKTLGAIARFALPRDLIEAARKVRKGGYSKFDCHSPFHIHGMDKAMGLKRSPLGWIVGLAAIIGCSGALALQWWVSVVEYPLVISGKPLFSYQAYVPITFALGVLLSAFAALLGMLIMNGLPRFHHPVFYHDGFESFSDDAFFISIESDDPSFDETETIRFLESIGGNDAALLSANDDREENGGQSGDKK